IDNPDILVDVDLPAGGADLLAWQVLEPATEHGLERLSIRLVAGHRNVSCLRARQPVDEACIRRLGRSELPRKAHTMARSEDYPRINEYTAAGPLTDPLAGNKE